MELFLTLKLYLRKTKLLEIELFSVNCVLTKTILIYSELFELEVFD